MKFVKIFVEKSGKIFYLKDQLSGQRQFLGTESASKMMKNAFILP